MNACLDIRFLPVEQACLLAQENSDQVFCLVDYGGSLAEAVVLPVPIIRVNMPQLTQPPLVEVWLSQGLVKTEWQSGEWIRYDDHFAISQVTFPESATAQSMYEQSQWAYRRLSDQLSAGTFPHLVRTWNYISRIGDLEGGLDRYQQFCRGRYSALYDQAGAQPEVMPAASALGNDEGELCLYYISAKQPVSFVENPRQVSAYNYPLKYGPKSPNFARAVLLQQPGQPVLLISGTASIVGHESLHVDDVEAQLRETLANIAHLIESSENSYSLPLKLRQIKVYLKQLADFPRVHALLQELAVEQTLILKADVCRPELLVEIEAVAW